MEVLKLFEKGADIEASAANDHRRSALGIELFKDRLNLFDPCAHSKAIGGAAYVDHFIAASVGRLIGADIEPAIDLKGVCVDELGVQLIRHALCDGGFAGAGRPHDGDQMRSGFLTSFRRRLAQGP